MLADASPSGGRHLNVLFAAALPWRELRDLARAMALRFAAIDPAPKASLGGQISPPGARPESGGWRLLTMPPEDARAAAEHPNGPEVWHRLLAKFAAELQKIEGSPGNTTASDAEAELDAVGVPWVPRLGGRAPLVAELAQAPVPDRPAALRPPLSGQRDSPARRGRHRVRRNGCCVAGRGRARAGTSGHAGQLIACRLAAHGTTTHRGGLAYVTRPFGGTIGPCGEPYRGGMREEGPRNRLPATRQEPDKVGMMCYAW